MSPLELSMILEAHNHQTALALQVEVKDSKASRSVVHLEEILWLTTRAKNHVFRARCHTFSGICATISKS